jgi:hypothetical protein
MISLLYELLNVSASLQDPPKLFVHMEQANRFSPVKTTLYSEGRYGVSHQLELLNVSAIAIFNNIFLNYVLYTNDHLLPMSL